MACDAFNCLLGSAHGCILCSQPGLLSRHGLPLNHSNKLHDDKFPCAGGAHASLTSSFGMISPFVLSGLLKRCNDLRHALQGMSRLILFALLGVIHRNWIHCNRFAPDQCAKDTGRMWDVGAAVCISHNAMPLDFFVCTCQLHFTSRSICRSSFEPT